MAWFIVRVELNGGLSADYTNLHEAMRKAGYSQSVISGEGKIYKMPPAEYVAVLADSFTAIGVRNTLQPIVAAVHAKHEIFVSKAVEVAWWLHPVS
jgi:hypothetical protein